MEAEQRLGRRGPSPRLPGVGVHGSPKGRTFSSHLLTYRVPLAKLLTLGLLVHDMSVISNG